MKSTSSKANTQPKTITKCTKCSTEFESKSSLFRHLRRNSKECMTKEEHDDFLSYSCKTPWEKTIILYGYLPDQTFLERSLHENLVYGSSSSNSVSNKQQICKGGEDAARIVTDAVWNISLKTNKSDAKYIHPDSKKQQRSYIRSLGGSTRNNSIILQDEYTSAITEVLTTKAPPLITKESLFDWLDDVNNEIQKLTSTRRIKVFARKKVPSNLNPELHATQRRMAYLLPADFLYTAHVREKYPDILDFYNALPSFLPWESSFHNDSKEKEKNGRPHETMLQILYDFKKLFKALSTQTQLIDNLNDDLRLEKEWAKRHRTKEKRKRKKSKNGKEDNEVENDFQEQAKEDLKPIHVLCRKRYHNFTKNVMAHEFLAYRRIDRFFHRSTCRYNKDLELVQKNSRPFLILSLTGDQFLTGQIQGMIGLFLAIIHDYISRDFIDVIFDESYPHLVPAPFFPSRGLFALDCMFMNWEGKLKSLLTPRKDASSKHINQKDHELAWNDESILTNLHDWEIETVLPAIVKAWLKEGETNSILNAKTIWLEQVVKPWAKRANLQLEEYKQWKSSQQQCIMKSLTIPAKPVPKIYQKVLMLLQEINTSNTWPSTTPKRQLVIYTQNTQSTLSVAHYQAKSNQNNITPYQCDENGASGSFSVGYVPSDENESLQQPRANVLFKELVQAAFQLEADLKIPQRILSSTIAINRNAQFRPHVDTGIGSGQNISLIVGLGDYSGGELVVEGNKIDIQYNPVEFNGWKERHWTMPFEGERYSLVWFTPKGCEGYQGINLYK